MREKDDFRIKQKFGRHRRNTNVHWPLPVLSTYTFGILASVGLILVLIALNGFANIYKEKGIFNNSTIRCNRRRSRRSNCSHSAFCAVLTTATISWRKSTHLGTAHGHQFPSAEKHDAKHTNIRPSDVLPFIEGIYRSIC